MRASQFSEHRSSYASTSAAETATRTLYRASSRGSVSPKAKGQKALQKLCFEAHHFVKALAAYVFDSAIASHWKPFLDRIGTMQQRLAPTSDPNSEDDLDGFDDVFSISTHHSDTLDKILTACFLKSRHRTAGAAVKKPLQLILNVAGLLADTRRSDVNTQEAKLVEMHKSWDASMRHLVSTHLSRPSLYTDGGVFSFRRR